MHYLIPSIRYISQIHSVQCPANAIDAISALQVSIVEHLVMLYSSLKPQNPSLLNERNWCVGMLSRQKTLQLEINAMLVEASEILTERNITEAVEHVKTLRKNNYLVKGLATLANMPQEETSIRDSDFSKRFKTRLEHCNPQDAKANMTARFVNERASQECIKRFIQELTLGMESLQSPVGKMLDDNLKGFLEQTIKRVVLVGDGLKAEGCSDTKVQANKAMLSQCIVQATVVLCHYLLNNSFFSPIEDLYTSLY